MKSPFLFCLLIFIAPLAQAQNLKSKLETAYTRFENDPQMQFASSSLTVLNGQTGEVIFSKNGNMGLASASTLKTVTSVTAYHLLGKDFTWETSLGYTGELSPDGVLNGNIIITGSGDPSLGSDRYDQSKPAVILKRWTDAIARAGIKSVSGRVISDDHLFGTQTLPGGWTWHDIGNYYGAGPSSLTWRENQFDLIFKAGSIGQPAELVRTEPAMPYLKVMNEVTTGRTGTGDNVYGYSAPYMTTVYVRGTYGVDLKKAISLSVPDPAYDLAQALSSSLQESGIKVSEAPSTARLQSLNDVVFQPPVKVLDIYSSPSLDRIVYWFNQRSINLFGEHLLKTLAWKQNKDITTPAGVDLLKDFWNSRLGIDKDALNIYDGSGLSPSNRITTTAMAAILQSVRRESWYPGFYESLPLINGLKMKSGTISDVIAYTGYHTASDGTPVVFSFLLNNYRGSASSARQKLFSVLDQLK